MYDGACASRIGLSFINICIHWNAYYRVDLTSISFDALMAIDRQHLVSLD